MPSTPQATKVKHRVSFKLSASAEKYSSKRMLSEKSLNATVRSPGSQTNFSNNESIATTANRSLKLTIEVLDRLEKDRCDVLSYLDANLDNQNGSLEIFGWSRGKSIPSSFYDKILKPERKIKRLMLRGRGSWDSCHCPKKTSVSGELIDTITDDNTTSLEHLYIMRTFSISSCTLLHLIARSPKLKVVRFYGVLTKHDHHEPFKFVRFLSDLDALHWPWCSKKLHFPTLKTLVKRQDKVSTFYSNGEITCDLLAADTLQNLQNLSLVLNEDWNCKPGSTKKASRYLKKISYLSQAKNLKALEIRSFDLTLDEEDEDQAHLESIKQLYETYQVTFWEHVAKMKELEYLAIYGAWELDKVTRTLLHHGVQIEFFKTNLMPQSMMPAVDARDNDLILSINESIRNLGKLAKLRSVHFTCHENLVGIEAKTVSALKELSDLIWVFDIRTSYTPEVEDLLTSMLRRGNQLGKGYKMKILIENSETDFANTYLEVHPKFSTTGTLKDRLHQPISETAKARFGKSTYKQFHFWGIEQDNSSRDKIKFDQLQSSWNSFEDIFNPIDMFV